MKLKLFLTIFISLSISNLYSGTTVTVTSAVPSLVVPTTGLQELAAQVQDISDLNGPIYSNAYAFANIQGYPIGKSTIGTFPHFQFGTALAVGLTNMKYFEDGSEASDNGSVPGIAVSPVVHFGIGLGGGFDVIGKFFMYRLSMYDPEYSKSSYTLEKFNFYTIGGMIRYNWLKEAMLIPFILDFGGLSFSLSCDMMRGNIGIGIDYDYQFDSIEVDAGGTPVTVNPDFNGDFGSELKWYQVAFTFRSVAYFDLFVLFSTYTGFGLSWGYGWFTTEFTGVGSITSNDPAITAINSSGEIGTLTFESKNKYNPDQFLPTYIFGLEMNLSILKLNCETMVNLRNREDVSVLVGTRVQF